MSDHDCYQVKLQVNLNEEEQNFFEKFGESIIKISRSKDNNVLSESIVETTLNKKSPSILNVTAYVELERLFENVEETENLLQETTMPATTVPETTVPETTEPPLGGGSSVEPARFNIFVRAGKYENRLVTFVVYPLKENVVAKGTFNDNLEYEITRVPCYDTSESAEEPRKLRLVVPLTKDLQCLLPDLGLSGLLLNQAIETNLKTKVRIVTSTPNMVSLPAVMSFDKESCTACLEFDADKDYESMVKGYKYLYDCENVKSEELANKIMSPMSKPFEILSMFRSFEVKGVAKCTEKTLLSFDICHVALKPVRIVDGMNVVELEDERKGNSYRVSMMGGTEYSYEFSN